MQDYGGLASLVSFGLCMVRRCTRSTKPSDKSLPGRPNTEVGKVTHLRLKLHRTKQPDKQTQTSEKIRIAHQVAL